LPPQAAPSDLRLRRESQAPRQQPAQRRSRILALFRGCYHGKHILSKQEIVAFDQVLEGFQDALVMSRAFSKYTLDSVTAERSGDTIWRPEPYIAQSYTGLDQSSNFARSYAQLSVPATIGYDHHVPLTLSALELRDALQEQRLGKAAMQRLASDINVDCSNLAALTGTIVVKRTTAATGFDDMAAADTAMNRLGIDMMDRKIFLSSADYNSMASNLAGRGTFNADVKDAYTKAQVPGIAGFDAFKLDYAYRLAAAAGVTVTVNGANQRYVPVATTVDANGGRHNVDNRFQTLAITVSSGTVKVGDAFTIAGVNEVHHITKADTGTLKTFRVNAILTGCRRYGQHPDQPADHRRRLLADRSGDRIQERDRGSGQRRGDHLAQHRGGSGQCVLAGRGDGDHPGPLRAAGG
jgi:hypothetical protein